MVDELPHSLHYKFETDLLDLSINPKISSFLYLSNELSWIEKDLRGDASAGETDSTRLVFVDDRDPYVGIFLNHRIDDIHRRPGSDHDKVVFFHAEQFRPS